MYLFAALPQGRELKLLQALDFVARQLKSVSLHVVAMETTVEVRGMLVLVDHMFHFYNESNIIQHLSLHHLPPDPYPEVSVSGCRSALHLTFALHPHLFHSLPATLTASRGVKVHPVLLNKGSG